MLITIEVPPELGDKLTQLQDRLPELLARGLREIELEEQAITADEATIMRTLASRPTPQEVLALKPLPTMQARVSELLAQNKRGQLSHEEERELDRYLMLEHLMRLAKVQAKKDLYS